MAYNSTLPTPKIEGALLASLKTKKIEYNITQDKSSNYASLAEAIAAVDDDEYKVKGIVLTFYTGTDWVSKRYNSEDASGFADEGNWIDVGGTAGGTQYLDLSMFSAESGTLSDEDYQKVVKAYEEGICIVAKKSNNLDGDLAFYYGTKIMYDGENYVFAGIGKSATNYNDYTSLEFYVSKNEKEYRLKETMIAFLLDGSGTKALTDNGRYADFAKPTKVENGGSGIVTKSIKPNIFYKCGECSHLIIDFNEEESGILNEYMFEFVSGSTPTTLSLPETVKWSGGNAPTIEASKTYQVSIVNNYAVFAAF